MIVKGTCCRCMRWPVVGVAVVADRLRAIASEPRTTEIARQLAALAADLDCHAEACPQRPRTPSQERPLP